MSKDRLIAFRTLMDVEDKKAYSNLALNHRILSGSPDSPAFVRKVVYGVLENKRYLDAILLQLMSSPQTRLRSPEQTILRMGLYQLMEMDGVPAYAAVQESVALAKRFCKGRDGFVNAVLRNYQRKKEQLQLPNPETDLIGYLSTRYSYSPWIVELWLGLYPKEFVIELLVAGNQIPELVVRRNRLRIAKEEFLGTLNEKGFQATVGNLAEDAIHVSGHDLLSDSLYLNGFFSVQDESSMMAVMALDPKPGESVIDVCAGVGGKTLYCAERMENRGEIIACDLYPNKLERLSKEGERLGVDMVSTAVWDATVSNPLWIETADRVLVDVPCSGLGVIRRKPEIKYKEDMEELRLLPEIQKKCLEVAATYVKRGGVLVYSTCTIHPLENEGITDQFLTTHPDFESEESITLLPNTHHTDGFYICKMKRRSDGEPKCQK